MYLGTARRHYICNHCILFPPLHPSGRLPAKSLLDQTASKLALHLTKSPTDAFPTYPRASPPNRYGTCSLSPSASTHPPVAETLDQLQGRLLNQRPTRLSLSLLQSTPCAPPPTTPTACHPQGLCFSIAFHLTLRQFDTCLSSSAPSLLT